MGSKYNVLNFENIVCLNLILSGILYTYGWKLSFWVISAMFLFVFYCLKGMKGFPRNFPPYFSTYVVYFVFAYTLSFLWYPFYIHYNLILIILILYMYYNTIRLDNFLYWYKKMATIWIAFFIVQCISYYLFNKGISGVFTFLPISIAVDSNYFISNLENSYRFASFFSEPSHFGLFLAPLLSIELFYYNDSKHYIRAVVLLIILLMTQSGNSLILIIPCAIMMVYVLIKQKMSANHIVLYTIMIGILFAISVFFLNSEMGHTLLERKEEFTYNGSSAYVRIIRGFLLFDDYSLTEKILGVNHSSGIMAHIQSSGMSNLFITDDGENLFFNNIHNILLYTGFLGLSIFILFILHILKKGSLVSKVIALQFFFVSFSEDMFINDRMIFYLMLISLFKDIDSSLLSLSGSK